MAIEAQIEDEVLQGLGRELLRMSRRRIRRYPGGQLEISAFRLLWVLEENGAMTLREIAEELQLEQSTVNRQVNGALDAGLIERLVAPSRQAHRVRATASGREVYRHDFEIRAAVFRDVLADLGPEQAQATIEGMRALNDAFDRAFAE